MAGTSQFEPSTIEVQVSESIIESIKEIDKGVDRFDPPTPFDAFQLIESGAACPICGGAHLDTLADLANALNGIDQDELEIVPEVRIGATGIVLPDKLQLARWFKVPIPPKFKKSRLHKKAEKDGKHLGVFTFLSTISFETVFFNPTIFTMGIAAVLAVTAAFRGWLSIHKLALEEDKGIALELTVRKRAFRARNDAWQTLYYCSDCGMVHDREGRRSLPWYSMLQFVHYPEQEFLTAEVPKIDRTIVQPVPRRIKKAA